MTIKNRDKKEPMPEELEQIYEGLSQEVIWLHAKWKIFFQLFAVSEERVKFLGEKASSFFRIIQDVLRDDIFLSLSRLTDPPETGNKENLSLSKFVKQLNLYNKTNYYKNLKDSYEKIKEHCEPFRHWRNRRIAHNDYLTTLDYHPEPLPGISRKMIEDALRMIRDFLNLILTQFDNSTVDYEHVFMMGDGDSIVAYLQQAEEHKKCKRKKHS